ncbi:hypothetical protein MLD38_027980 [Melastoma candidum]|uniref:Uncharacterized protein n=1 Tax=Melastoma candidum TaxID=119954 RepID=A0ACB9N1C5_9MYRT|nr:hypothetical protein MLD38_027980 [Melastoma candidum]
MVSEAATSSGDSAEFAEDGMTGRSSLGKIKSGKVPKRIHKAAKEKQKREHFNELFLDLANALELNQQNNGKASILNEAARLLKEIFSQIETLKKENLSLVSESHYVTMEKNELKEENSAVEEQIEKLRDELMARVAESTPNLNEPPPVIVHAELASNIPEVEPPLQQTHAVFIVPLQPDVPSYKLQSPNICKPHARYPTPTDVWPSQLLGDTTTGMMELQPCSDGNDLSRKRDPSSM